VTAFNNFPTLVSGRVGELNHAHMNRLFKAAESAEELSRARATNESPAFVRQRPQYYLVEGKSSEQIISGLRSVEWAEQYVVENLWTELPGGRVSEFDDDPYYQHGIPGHAPLALLHLVVNSSGHTSHVYHRLTSVHAAKITATSGGPTDATYHAATCGDSAFIIEGAVPINRQAPGSFYTVAPVGSPCLISVDENANVHLILWEQLVLSECQDGGGPSPQFVEHDGARL
jgi:hypothetical protein